MINSPAIGSSVALVAESGYITAAYLQCCKTVWIEHVLRKTSTIPRKCGSGQVVDHLAAGIALNLRCFRGRIRVIPAENEKLSLSSASLRPNMSGSRLTES